MRIAVWVRPGRPALAWVVTTGARWSSGSAPRAVAFGGCRTAVTLVSGATSRAKTLDVAGADPAGLARLLAQ